MKNVEMVLAQIDGKHKYAIRKWRQPNGITLTCNWGNGRLEHVDLPEWWHYT